MTWSIQLENGCVPAAATCRPARSAAATSSPRVRCISMRKSLTLSQIRVPVSTMDWCNSDLRQRRSEEHTSELQSRSDLVCRLLLEKKKKNKEKHVTMGKRNIVIKQNISLVHETRNNIDESASIAGTGQEVIKWMNTLHRSHVYYH